MRLRIFAVLGLLGVVLSIAWFRRPRAAHVDARLPAAVGERAAPAPFEDRRVVLPASRPVDRARPPEDGVVIESVEVDKREVCKGEQVVVTTHARSNRESEDYLSFGAAGKPDLVGPRFALRVSESIGADRLNVFVRGRGGSTTLAPIPSVTVKDCEAPIELEIAYTRSPSAPDRALLEARVDEHAGSSKSFSPDRYEWDFGDGTTLVSSAPNVEHSYEGRRQNQAYSYFFVTVKARDLQGHEEKTARSLRFVNLGFLSWTMEQRVTLFAGFGADADGSGAERIWLYHGAPFAVRLDQVAIRDVAIDEHGAEVTIATRNYDPSRLLGFAEIPVATGATALSLDGLRPSDPTVVRVVEISGRGPGSAKASGAFTLTPRPAKVATSNP